MRANKIILLLAGILLIAALFSWAASQGGSRVAGLPLFALCAAGVFLLQWLVFIPSYLARTEHFFDLTGSLSYIGVVLIAFLLTDTRDSHALLLTALVCIWAARLGSFLFLRVRRDGRDGRFDKIKQSFPRFLLAWTLQGLWVLLTASAALAAITTSREIEVGPMVWAGLILWLTGFTIEVIADQQKNRFRADAENRERFIQQGLWRYSRHPNYFGEILLWLGIALIALPALTGWQYLTLISPLFVYLLLTRISGIPLLEARAEKRWGDRTDYQHWKAVTPRLVPRMPRQG